MYSVRLARAADLQTSRLLYCRTRRHSISAQLVRYPDGPFSKFKLDKVNLLAEFLANP